MDKAKIVLKKVLCVIGVIYLIEYALDFIMNIDISYIFKMKKCINEKIATFYNIQEDKFWNNMTKRFLKKYEKGISI